MEGVPKDWRKTFVGRIQDTTREDIRKTLREYYLPLFDAEKSVAVISCSPADVEQMLVARGYEVIDSVRSLDGEDNEGDSEDDSEDDGEDEDDDDDEDDGEDDGGVDNEANREVDNDASGEVNGDVNGEVNSEVSNEDVG